MTTFYLVTKHCDYYTTVFATIISDDIPLFLLLTIVMTCYT